MRSSKLVSVIIAAIIFILPIFPAMAEYGIQIKSNNCVSDKSLPDSSCTLGAILTMNVKTICKSGYTKTVRNVSLKERKQVFAEYGIPYKQSGKYEVDHLISLEIGGSNDISNLWPEPYSIKDNARIKDKFENYLHAQVCSGKMALEEAQNEISANWLEYYNNSISIVKSLTPSYTPTPYIFNNSANGATAECNDRTYSFANAHRGACSHHGGVMIWYK